MRVFFLSLVVFFSLSTHWRALVICAPRIAKATCFFFLVKLRVSRSFWGFLSFFSSSYYLCLCFLYSCTSFFLPSLFCCCSVVTFLSFAGFVILEGNVFLPVTRAVVDDVSIHSSPRQNYYNNTQLVFSLLLPKCPDGFVVWWMFSSSSVARRFVGCRRSSSPTIEFFSFSF